MAGGCYVCGSGIDICDPCRKRYVVPPGAPYAAAPYRQPGTQAPQAMPIDIPKKRSSYDEDREDDRIREARERGFTILKSNARLLFVDIDHADGLDSFAENIGLIDKMFGVKQVDYWRSKSGWPHTHVVVWLEIDVGSAARIALEASLGSDPKRTILNTAKLSSGDREVSLLFRPPEAVIHSITKAPWKI